MAKGGRGGETQEERQWKQMQASLRQQQQQGVLPNADQHGKDGIVPAGAMGMAGTPPGVPFTSTSPLGGPRMMPPGSPGVAQPGMEGVRQPLQVCGKNGKQFIEKNIWHILFRFRDTNMLHLLF